MALVNASNASKREIALYFNTLACLVKSLENRYTSIDLRNDFSITGKIKTVDGSMNIDMEDVVLYDSRGNQKFLTNFFINARNIRNVHMPSNTDAIKLIEAQLSGMKRKKTNKKTFKQSRAEKRTAETVSQAYK